MCKIADCNVKLYAKNMCHKHYDKARRLENIEKYRKISRDWGRNNKDKIKSANKRRNERLGMMFDITSEQYRSKLNWWAKRVHRKFNNKCIICNSNEGVSAHHIFYKRNYPQLSLNINNGVLLCINHHNEIHETLKY